MRRLWLFILSPLCLIMAGCIFFRSGADSLWPGRTRPVEPTSTSEIAMLEGAVLETPIGNRTINEDIWTTADEQILPAALRLKLQENGLRVGLVTGRADQLLQLLTSARTNPNPKRYIRQPGRPVLLPLASALPACGFSVTDEDRPRIVTLEQANCQIQVVPTIDPDGKMRLQFTPQIEFDDPEKWNRINPTLALPVQGKPLHESFAALRFEVPLGPEEYIIIGGRFDRPDSLGHRFFITPDEERPVQRLIAVRDGRSPQGNGGGSMSTLASQAASK